jgi:hypothetical protein
MSKVLHQCTLAFWVWLLAAVWAQGRAATAQCPVVDATQEVWDLRRSLGEMSAAEQVAAFRQRVVAAHRGLYEPGVLGIPASRLDGDIAQTLAGLPRREVEIRAMQVRLNSALPDIVEQFAAVFPAFRCNFPIYLTFSLGHFDGAGRIVDGQPAMVLGVDNVAYLTPQGLPIFIAHELFHRYHYQAAGFSDDASEHQAIWRSLWVEGLATYVSGRLNPNRSLPEVLFSADLEERGTPLIPKMARQLMHGDRPDPALYGLYFEADPRDSDIPPRAGYLVGYRVAEILAQHRRLSELSRLRGEPLHKEVDRALALLAASP